MQFVSLDEGASEERVQDPRLLRTTNNPATWVHHRAVLKNTLNAFRINFCTTACEIWG